MLESVAAPQLSCMLPPSLGTSWGCRQSQGCAPTGALPAQPGYPPSPWATRETSLNGLELLLLKGGPPGQSKASGQLLRDLVNL